MKMIGRLTAMGVMAAGLLGLMAPLQAAGQELVLYSGRSKNLVQPIIQKFTEATGVDVQVRYGSTSQLAVALKEEGQRTRADAFLAQDAGALGAMVDAGLFAKLPEELLNQVAQRYRNPEGYWVATSGRARTLAYSPERVEEENLPASVFDLTQPEYEGRVGWAPTNASFQAFVTAMRRVHGDERALQWLKDMKANGARAYPNNTGIIQGIAAGEVDLGLPNHYYLLRFKDDDPNYPVEQTLFDAGDVGNLINVAGIGVLAPSQKQELAQQLVAYLLSEEAQRYFATETFEYPVTDAVEPDPRLPDRDRLSENAPHVDLDSLDDLEGTLELLREAGLL